MPAEKTQLEDITAITQQSQNKMAQQKTAFIKVPTDTTGGFQTMPTEPSRRIPDADIRLELCTEADAPKIVCFPIYYNLQTFI